MTDLVWNVVYHDINTDKIKVYNIFKHGSFMEELQKHYKKHKTKETFAEALRRSLMYYFWSKCEWEVLISPWCGSKKNEAIKVDVYWQVMNNWDHFLDYVWNAKHRKTPKNPNYIDINSIANIPDAVIDELVLACVRSGNASEEYISRLEQAIIELRKKGAKDEQPN